MTAEHRVRLNAKFIRHMLAERNISARELASTADIGEATMYRLLNGAKFNSGTLGKLAEALGCHPVDLVDAEGYSSPHLVASPT